MTAPHKPRVGRLGPAEQGCTGFPDSDLGIDDLSRGYEPAEPSVVVGIGRFIGDTPLLRSSRAEKST